MPETPWRKPTDHEIKIIERLLGSVNDGNLFRQQLDGLLVKNYELGDPSLDLLVTNETEGSHGALVAHVSYLEQANSESTWVRISLHAATETPHRLYACEYNKDDLSEITRLPNLDELIVTYKPPHLWFEDGFED
jgi:hypothetical protein